MSGIVGVQGHMKGHMMREMLEQLKHRGPDKVETYPSGHVALGEVRSVHEPAFTCPQEGTEETGVLVLDGEPSYRGRKIDRDDLYALYLKSGEKVIEELGDDFAFMLTDGENLVVARDVFGTRPLYYVAWDHRLVFASEMKALTDWGRDVHIFPPGTYYTTESGFKTFKQVPGFQSQLDADPGTGRYYQKADELQQLLIEAVQNNIDKDTKTGVFLSGGVDSSIIAACLNKVTHNPVKTFAVGVAGSEDVLKARKVAEFIDADHTELTYDEQDMLDVLPEVIYHLESFDVELVNSSIANFLVARIAREAGIETVLSGEGADELFGGYHHLKDYTAEALNNELEGLLKGLHNGGLQRVDRMTKAHALNCRMPFFDQQVIDFAREIPCQWKIPDHGMEKLILRQAFDGMLPDEVLWRKKAQFGIGSGNEGTMEEIILKEITDKEYYKAQGRSNIQFKSKIEYYYYKIFKGFYPDKSADTMVNRWLV